MFGWLRELYEIRRENKMSRCESCDILKVELAAERREKERLLNHILHPKSEDEPVISGDPQPVVLKHKPWRVRQQELEAQDRAEAARIMAKFEGRVKTVVPKTTEDLEKEMGIKNA